MTLTDAELTEIARTLAERIFVETSQTAHSDQTALKAAVQAIDQGMEATTNQIQSQAPGEVLKVALRNHIKASSPNLSDQQAGVAVALWALHEVGLL